ncbi:MAG TPA: response regulator [Ktedonobacterales bacterium]|jgi:CheY-like chemotaxis protein
MGDPGTETSKHPQSPAIQSSVDQVAEIPLRENRRPILICEDDDEIRELLVDAIQEEGFEVTATRNGSEALAVLEEKPGRYLFLLDLMMPGINGYDILERMAASDALSAENSVVIVSATGYIRLISPAVLEKQFVKAMLKKPFELDELFDLLHRFS